VKAVHLVLLTVGEDFDLSNADLRHGVLSLITFPIVVGLLTVFEDEADPLTADHNLDQWVAVQLRYWEVELALGLVTLSLILGLSPLFCVVLLKLWVNLRVFIANFANVDVTICLSTVVVSLGDLD